MKNEGRRNVRKLGLIFTFALAQMKFVEGNLTQQAQASGIEAHLGAGKMSAKVSQYSLFDIGGASPAIIEEPNARDPGDDREHQASDKPFPPGHAPHAAPGRELLRIEDGGSRIENREARISASSILLLDAKSKSRGIVRENGR